MLKKILLFAALLVPALSFGQGNVVMSTGAGAPSGPCSYVRFYIRTSNGDMYNCWLGVWQKITSGGGAPVGGTGTTNTLAKFTGASTIGNSSVTDSGTVVSTQVSFGIGTTAPVTELSVFSASTSSPRGILSSQYTTDAGPSKFVCRKARGTATVPTTIVTADALCDLDVWAYDGSNFLNTAGIRFGSSGTIAATRTPSFFAIDTSTDATPSVRTERVRVDNTGKVGIGTGAPAVGVQISNYIKSAPATSGTTQIAALRQVASDGTGALDFGSRAGGNAWLQVSDVTALGTHYNLELQPIGGFVGIGTASPGFTLDVVGTIKGSTAIVTPQLQATTAGGTVMVADLGGANYSYSFNGTTFFPSGSNITSLGKVGNLFKDLMLGGRSTAASYATATNCADSAGAAACGSAAAGAVVIDAGATTVVVSTTAVTANSRIFVTYDSSLAAELGITCNATAALPYVTARTAATSFTISVAVAPITNPGCYDYFLVN